MLKKTEDEIYIKEMEVWIQQQQNRLHSCEIAIDYHTATIRNARAGIVLERKQTRFIKQQKQQAEKDVSDYKKKHGLK